MLFRSGPCRAQRSCSAHWRGRREDVGRGACGRRGSWERGKASERGSRGRPVVPVATLVASSGPAWDAGLGPSRQPKGPISLGASVASYAAPQSVQASLAPYGRAFPRARASTTVHPSRGAALSWRAKYSRGLARLHYSRGRATQWARRKRRKRGGRSKGAFKPRKGQQLGRRRRVGERGGWPQPKG